MKHWMVAAAMVLSGAASANAAIAVEAMPAWTAGASGELESELVAKVGEPQHERIHRGLAQVANFWRAADGDRKTFEDFVRANYAGDDVARDALFTRFQHNLEMLDGHSGEINRELRNQIDLDVGTILPFDEAFGGYSPTAHVLDDFFANKLAFTALLNFPLTTLEERLAHGSQWSRRQWAETRLAERFAKRTPAAVVQAIADAGAASDQYIADYNIWMHHLVDADGKRLFPPGLRLLSHWNLRDEIKADYSDAATGLAKQRTLQKVMERIVTQSIPAIVVNNPAVDWNPQTNEVRAAAEQDADPAPPLAGTPSNAPEPDRRYELLLRDFQAQRLADPYSPTAPTHIARRFDEDRQIPEARVQAMFEQVLGSKLVVQVAALIKQRLGRDLEPFDLWYNGFLSRGKYTEEQLDAIVSRKYPTAAAYQKDIPVLLRKLGFTEARARMLAANIVVDPARGSGHALGAQMRSAPAHLRTRVEKGGMNYKGYNIAVHEMGHNVEETFSLNLIDFTLLNGVPNTAFTEALAFVFQNRDLELLGLAKPDAKSEALKTLNDFWATYEIAGVALVDMGIWHWMYTHEGATPAQVRDATLSIARDIWNRYYAPVFGQTDVVLLGIYSHMINNFLYLPDYPIGHMIAFQIEQQIARAGTANRGREFERMATTGRVTPDEWMIKATGRPVGPEALLEATQAALAGLNTATAPPAAKARSKRTTSKK